MIEKGVTMSFRSRQKKKKLIHSGIIGLSTMKSVRAQGKTMPSISDMTDLLTSSDITRVFLVRPKKITQIYSCQQITDFSHALFFFGYLQRPSLLLSTAVKNCHSVRLVLPLQESNRLVSLNGRQV